MPDTIPNIIIQPDTITNLYTAPEVVAAGISVGDKINVAMIGQGTARLYSGATAPAKIDNDSGYRNIKANESFTNDLADAGAFAYSRNGCTVNVKGV